MKRNFKKILLLIMFVLFFDPLWKIERKLWAECRPAKNMEDVHAASCRIHATQKGSRQGSLGTGTVCLKKDGKYWILTNWHVIQGADTIKLHFFGNGSIHECNGKIENVWYDAKAPYDFAVLTVLEEELTSYDPPFVPLGPQGTKPEKNKMILSSGCSEGRWAMAWKGIVDSYYGNTAQFMPAPKSGQSGSAIIQKINGDLCISGLLTWRVGDEHRLNEENMRGGAIPITLLYDAAEGKKPAGDLDNVPPCAVWVNTVFEDRFDPSQLESEENPALMVRRFSIMDAETYFRPVADKRQTLAFAAYTISGCAPCKNAVPILEKLKKEGYPIHIISVDSFVVQNRIKDLHINTYPTFIMFSLEDEKWIELERFTDTVGLEERIRTSFEKYQKNTIDLKQQESGSLQKFWQSIPKDQEKDLLSKDQKNKDRGGVTLGKFPNGDISPLLDAYRNPQIPMIGDKGTPPKDRSTPQPNHTNESEKLLGIFAKERKEKEDSIVLFNKSLEGISTGLQERLNGLSGKMEDKIKKRIDDITDSLAQKGETLLKKKIDEVSHELQKQLVQYLQKIFWRVVFLIVVFWYLFYWTALGLKKIFTRLLSIPFPFEIRYAGKSQQSN